MTTDQTLDHEEMIAFVDAHKVVIDNPNEYDQVRRSTPREMFLHLWRCFEIGLWLDEDEFDEVLKDFYRGVQLV